MRSRNAFRLVLSLTAALAAAATIAAGGAAAAETTLYTLPTATHASMVEAGPDGTVWWVAENGPEHKAGGSGLGKIAPDGTVEELPASELGGVLTAGVGPLGEVWVIGDGKKLSNGRYALFASQISSTGELIRRYKFTKDWSDSYLAYGEVPPAVGSGAVWIVVHRFDRRPGIARVDVATGAVREIVLRPECHVTGLAAAGNSAWFSEACTWEKGARGRPRGSVNQIGPNGKIKRHPLPSTEQAVSLAIGPEGTVWFGAERVSNHAPFVGTLESDGQVDQLSLPSGTPRRIAAGPGRLWFDAGGFRSIEPHGTLSEPICGDPTCDLSSTSLSVAADGSLWYGLTRTSTSAGGGGSNLYWDELIRNEAGSIGHLVP